MNAATVAHRSAPLPVSTAARVDRPTLWPRRSAWVFRLSAVGAPAISWSRRSSSRITSSTLGSDAQRTGRCHRLWRASSIHYWTGSDTDNRIVDHIAVAYPEETIDVVRDRDRRRHFLPGT